MIPEVMGAGPGLYEELGSGPLLVSVRADRAWTDSDRDVLETIREGTPADPQLVLTRARDEALEAAVGEIPKRRSRIRQLVKRLARLELLR